MSGSHQFYTVTGRALPLPPKRTPSRHSTVLRLPTRRADQERSTTVRAHSPGRVEVPRGGEFHSIPDDQRRTSQLVVYQAPQPDTADATVRATVPSSVASSSVRRGSRHHSFAVVPSSHASSVRSHRSHKTRNAPRPPAAEAAVVAASKPASVASTYARADEAPPTRTVSAVESGHTTPRGPTAAFVVPSDSASSSGSSSPCLNRVKPTEQYDHHHYQQEEEVPHYTDEAEEEQDEEDMEAASAVDGVAAAAAVSANGKNVEKALYEAASEVESIPMSSTRHSRTPEDREPPQPPRLQHAAAAVVNASRHPAGSKQSSVSHFSSQPSRSAASSHPPSQHKQQLSQQQQQSSVPSAPSAPPRMRADPLSQQPYSASDVSSHRPASSVKSIASPHPSQRGMIVPVFVSPVAALARRGSASTPTNNNNNNNTTTTNNNNSTSRVQNISALNQSSTLRPSVERHDHVYSQRKVEERRASRPQVEPSASAYRPAAGSQALALVPAPAVVRYSSRSNPRQAEDDPLEMNTPIADRVRQRSAASPNRLLHTLEGTELLPSLPRLQGRRATTADDADRTYRTIVRFIEYQPEAERPELEEMLRDYEGHEEELCAVLTETYGEDFEMMKSVCNRGAAYPLLADRPRSANAASSQLSSAGLAAHDGHYGAGAAANSSSAASHDAPAHEEHFDPDDYYAVHPPSDSDDVQGEEAEYDDYMEGSSRPNSTPRVEEGIYDEEPMYDEDAYAHEMLTPALPYDQR